MPNGFYPVPGLQVLHIHRTEQGYPRIVWNQSWDRVWAVVFTGPGGYSPMGPLQLASHSPSFDQLVDAARAVLVADSQLPHTSASVMLIDFKQQVGWAMGEFCAYGFKNGEVQILHNLTVGHLMPPGVWPHTDLTPLEHPLTYLEAAGIRNHHQHMPSFEFRFTGMQELAVSSVALHYNSHWPPKNGLDVAMLALSRRAQRDQILSLWKSDAP